MIVDTSALVAVVFQEPDCEDLLGKLEAASIVAMGAPTLVEAGIVLSARMRLDARPSLRLMLEGFKIDIVQFGPAHWECAAGAFLTYGKGRHPAGLNLGDCMSYAAAKVARQPLLFAGEDFLQTDLVSA